MPVRGWQRTPRINLEKAGSTTVFVVWSTTNAGTLMLRFPLSTAYAGEHDPLIVQLTAAAVGGSYSNRNPPRAKRTPTRSMHHSAGSVRTPRTRFPSTSLIGSAQRWRNSANRSNSASPIPSTELVRSPTTTITFAPARMAARERRMSNSSSMSSTAEVKRRSAPARALAFACKSATTNARAPRRKIARSGMSSTSNSSSLISALGIRTY